MILFSEMMNFLKENLKNNDEFLLIKRMIENHQFKQANVFKIMCKTFKNYG